MKLLNMCAVIALSSLFSVVCFAMRYEPGIFWGPVSCKSKTTGAVVQRTRADAKGEANPEKICRGIGEDFVVAPVVLN